MKLINARSNLAPIPRNKGKPVPDIFVARLKSNKLYFSDFNIGPIKSTNKSKVKTLLSGEDFEIEIKRKSISFTDLGISKIERSLNVDNLYDPNNNVLSHFIENAVRAEYVYEKNRDYVIQEKEILIVDEFTGRLMKGRRFSDGLHQALEAKENLTIQKESVTYATITLQNYFRMYEKLSGMTGTASTEAEEFEKIYNLEVVEIPTNKPSKRLDHTDFIFMNESDKWKAVVNKIVEINGQKRPILVGTTSIDKSEILSSMLKRKGVKHNILNTVIIRHNIKKRQVKKHYDYYKYC